MRGGRHLLQSVSRADVVLLDLAERIGLARREALPPTVRLRHFVWEILAGRGVPSVAVNWWTADDARTGALDSVGQTSIFAVAGASHGKPQAIGPPVDESASPRC